jgi:uncharacterized protein (TIGR02246 family)
MPATTPEEIHRLFQDAFNAGDIDGLMALYEPDAAVIPQPGSVVHGTEQVRAGLQAFLALQGRITLDTKLVVTVGDLTFLSNTWSLTGTGPDGKPLTMGATTAEVVRRQADGTWRYVIDNVWGAWDWARHQAWGRGGRGHPGRISRSGPEYGLDTARSRGAGPGRRANLDQRAGDEHRRAAGVDRGHRRGAGRV